MGSKFSNVTHGPRELAGIVSFYKGNLNIVIVIVWKSKLMHGKQGDHYYARIGETQFSDRDDQIAEILAIGAAIPIDGAVLLVAQRGTFEDKHRKKLMLKLTKPYLSEIDISRLNQQETSQPESIQSPGGTGEDARPTVQEKTAT